MGSGGDESDDEDEEDEADDEEGDDDDKGDKDDRVGENGDADACRVALKSNERCRVGCCRCTCNAAISASSASSIDASPSQYTPVLRSSLPTPPLTPPPTPSVPSSGTAEGTRARIEAGDESDIRRMGETAAAESRSNVADAVRASTAGDADADDPKALGDRMG